MGLAAAALTMTEMPGLLAIIAGATAVLTLYGVGVLVGARNAGADVVAGVRMWIGRSST